MCSKLRLRGNVKINNLNLEHIFSCKELGLMKLIVLCRLSSGKNKRFMVLVVSLIKLEGCTRQSREHGGS